MLILRIAWRNLWRNTRRTILTLSAIAFATIILVFMVATQQGAYGAMIESAISVFTGDLQIQVQGYHDNPQVEKTIAGMMEMEKRISALPGVQIAAGRAEAYALVSSPTRSYGANIVGVEPQKEPRVSTIPRSILKGRFLSGAEAQEAVVGKTLAQNLSLSLGDGLTVLGQGRDGALAVGDFRIIGIFESGVPDLDRQVVEIPLKTFQSTFSMGDEGHAIVIRTANVDAVDDVAKDVQRALPGGNRLTVLKWDQLLEGLKQGIQMDAAVGWFLYAMLVLAITFSILNTFIMAVLERTREFGVFLALGTKPSFLERIVLTESFLLLMMGLAVGVLLGAAIAGYASVHGFAFSSSEELLTRWNLPAKIYPRLTLFSLTVGPLAVLVVTSVAALFPLVRVRRLRPVEAMKAV
jgi:putative ABC transport system permease protein